MSLALVPSPACYCASLPGTRCDFCRGIREPEEVIDTRTPAQTEYETTGHVTPDLPWLSAKELAVHIRAALKAHYPAVKFSVRSENYSMGSSVHTSWDDGPTQPDVERVLAGFHGKHFDGRDDSTSYTPITLTNGQRVNCGSYLSASRHLSADGQSLALRLWEAQYGQPYDPNARIPGQSPDGGDVYGSDLLHRLQYRIRFTRAGYVLVTPKR